MQLQMWVECKFFMVMTTLLMLGPSVYAQPHAAQEGISFQMQAGVAGVQNHKIQFGTEGTLVDLKREGAQDVLYTLPRFQVDYQMNAEHRLMFLYQPLDLRTEAVFDREVRFYEASFAAGSPVDIVFGFPFYRMSYLWTHHSFPASYGLGASLQLRNANISFSTVSGDTRRYVQNVGPVPTLKAWFEHALLSSPNHRLGFEIDAIYAPVSYLNGSDTDIVGAFTDAQIYWKLRLADQTNFSIFTRYVGGGAEGTNPRQPGPGDGFSSNWIDLVFFGIGVEKHIAIAQ